MRWRNRRPAPPAAVPPAQATPWPIRLPPRTARPSAPRLPGRDGAPPRTVWGLLVASALRAVLPDIDHPDGSVAYSFGFVTKGFAWLIEHVSGGHRHGTHSLAGIAAFTGAAYVAEHYRRTLGGQIGVRLL